MRNLPLRRLNTLATTPITYRQPLQQDIVPGAHGVPLPLKVLSNQELQIQESLSSSGGNRDFAVSAYVSPQN